MQYNPLSSIDRIEKTNILTNRIIVKALQSDRGDIIRAMNPADLKKMIQSVTLAVYNKIAAEAQLAYDYNFDKFLSERDCVITDKIAEFKLIPDAEIEEEVTAYFETKGKLQYREVICESFVVFPGIDESLEYVMQQMKMGVHGMRYNPYSVEDRLERADSLTNLGIIDTWRCEKSAPGDFIRALSYAEFKQFRKDVFTVHYHRLAAEAKEEFEQACKDYVPERDGIEKDPRKKFKPRTKLEIDQEINAYFEEQGTLH